MSDPCNTKGRKEDRMLPHMHAFLYNRVFVYTYTHFVYVGLVGCGTWGRTGHPQCRVVYSYLGYTLAACALMIILFLTFPFDAPFGILRRDDGKVCSTQVCVKIFDYLLRVHR